MSVEIVLGTPLADALHAAVQPKLVEVGWGTGGSDDAALAEYIILMLVNGKTQSQIATELASDLLNLSPDDPGVQEFSGWLFQQIEALNAQQNGGQQQQQRLQQQEQTQSNEGAQGEMDTDMASSDVADLNAPTGPRSMRNGSRGGRDKRMMGHMNKAMDRTGDNALHRVRGQTGGERINTHGRGSMAGPRGGRAGRHNNNRAANIQHGLAGMAGGPQAQQWMMQGGAPNQMELMAMLEQQNQMMFQLSQQLMNGNGNHQGGGGFGQRGRGGKSLFDRVQNPHHKNNHRNHNSNINNHNGNNKAGAEGSNAEGGAEEGTGDVDMSGNTREPPNPDDTVCKFNLSCTNKECKFAHQSPAAPPGTHVDVADVCAFGAACKNRKCVGRHPSPAQKTAHQNEQDCKFYPNCQNPRCPFRHPSMPLCRNGADCTTAGCKFTHVKTKCRFNPCLNPNCAFQHDEGQQGGFRDKVWKPEDHVSERKFVDEGAEEVAVRPDNEDGATGVQPQPDGQDIETIG